MKKTKTQKPVYWVSREGDEWQGRISYWKSDEFGIIHMIIPQEYQFHKIEELLEKILKKIK